MLNVPLIPAPQIALMPHKAEKLQIDWAGYFNLPVDGLSIYKRNIVACDTLDNLSPQGIGVCIIKHCPFSNLIFLWKFRLDWRTAAAMTHKRLPSAFKDKARRDNEKSPA
jgi:hypothetical protein